MCGGWVGEQLSNTASSIEKTAEDVGGSIVGAAEDVGGAIEDVVIDPIKEFGSSLEDAVRDAADDVNKVIENPYVQAIVTAINPTAGTILNSYATVNSGDDLSAGQIAALATAGYTAGTGVQLTPEVQKAIDVGTTVAEGGDVQDALISAYGGDFAKELGLDKQVKSALSDVVGSDFAQRINKNIDINQAAADYAAGNSTQRILANQFGDDVVGYLGAKSPSQRALGFAGIEGLIQKSEGASDKDALLASAETYYNKGGQLPDLNVVGSVADINVPKIDFGDTGFIKDLYAGTIGKLPNLPDTPDLGFIEDYIKKYAPNIKNPIDYKGLDLNFGDIVRSDIDLGKIDFDVNVPEIDFASIDTPDIPGFDVSMPDINLPDVNIPSLDLGLPQPTQRQPVQIDPTMIASAEGEEARPEDEQLDIAQLLLSDFSLKNPLLRS